jgi:hypothetical protein
MVLIANAGVYWRKVIVRKDASSRDLTAFNKRQFQALPRIAERRDPRTEQNGVNVQADSIHQARTQKRLCQFATAHQPDAFSRSKLKLADEFNRVALHEFHSRLVD